MLESGDGRGDPTGDGSELTIARDGVREQSPEGPRDTSPSEIELNIYSDRRMRALVLRVSNVERWGDRLPVRRS